MKTKHRLLAIAILAAFAWLLFPGCTQTEVESALRAASAASNAYYGPQPAVHLPTSGTVNPPGAPFPLYP